MLTFSFSCTGEPVELEVERTFAESLLLEDLEMQNALNAQKKNETRDQLRGESLLEALEVVGSVECPKEVRILGNAPHWVLASSTAMCMLFQCVETDQE